MDRDFFTRTREMVEVQMTPLAGHPAAQTFAENLWGENARRISDDKGKTRSDWTAARLPKRYADLGAQPPAWL